MMDQRTSQSANLLRTERRAVGRPRGFSDEDVFRATTRLLLNGGLANVTLKHVAARIGFSYQAVAQRFESKEGLVRAYFDWMGVVITDLAATIMAARMSSAERLLELLTLPIDPRLFDADTLELQASWTLVALELRREPVLEPIIARQNGEYGEFLATVVREGQEAGELAPGKPEEIAELVLAAGTGAAMQWLFGQREPLLVKMERCINLALRPYVIGPG